MNTRLLRIAVLPVLAALAGCGTNGGAGLTAGAYAARADDTRPIAAAIVDAMAGGLIGRSIGPALDPDDRREALEAEYHALEYTPAGKPVNWGGRFGARGEVIAGAPYRVGSQDCRQYTHTVFISGEAQVARGAACRNDNGSWTPLV